MNNILELHTKLAGEYRMVVTRADGTEQDTGWFDNLVLNSGLDRIGNATSNFYVITNAQVGTGTSAPAATQTALDAWVAGSASSTSSSSITNSGAPNYETTRAWTFTFAQGAVVGNITEIGVGWATNGSLFSRARILDNLGSPTSITLVALDQLTVYYRLKITPLVTDMTGTVVISSVSYPYTARVSNAGTFGNATWLFAGAQAGWSGSVVGIYGSAGQTFAAGSVLGAITGSPTLSSGSTGTVAAGPYTAGTFYRDDVWTWNATQGNATGGIQCIVFPFAFSSVNFQYRFSTVIPKTNTNTLSLTTRISWAAA